MMFIVYIYGYGSIPINTIFSGMNIHFPAILGFTRYQGFDTLPYMYSYVHTISLITEIEGNPIDLVLMTIFKLIFL